MSSPKLQRYKQQLLDHLISCGWELIEIDELDDGDCPDFLVEQWTIRSVREMRGYELILTFVKYDYGAYCLIATTSRPAHYMDFVDQVASLSFDHGLYNETMSAFVREINDHKDGLGLQDSI